MTSPSGLMLILKQHGGVCQALRYPILQGAKYFPCRVYPIIDSDYKTNRFWHLWKISNQCKTSLRYLKYTVAICENVDSVCCYYICNFLFDAVLISIHIRFVFIFSGIDFTAVWSARAVCEDLG